MGLRPDIIAGRAVIIVSVADHVNAQLRKIRANLRRFANSINQLGGNLFRFGATGVFGSLFPVKSFMEFQDQLLFLQTKLKVTDRIMIGMETTIRNLGKSTSFTATEVGGAATEFAKAGFSAEETTRSLQAGLDLARAGQVDLSTSTAILANNLRTFGKSAFFASEFADKFIVAARLGTLDIVDLNESLKESSGTFRQLGIDLDGALGLITQLSLSSLKGTKAGTSLNTAFLNLASNADILQDKLGIALSDDDIANPVAVFTKLDDAIKRLGRQEVVSTLRDIFNIRGGRAAGSILIQGLDNLQNTLDQLANSAEEARLAAIKLDSALGGAFRRAKSAFEDLLIAVGGTSEGPLEKFLEGFRKVTIGISRVASDNPKLAQQLLLVPPIALAAGAALLTISFALGQIAGLLSPIIALIGVGGSLGASFVGLNIVGFTKFFKAAGKFKSAGFVAFAGAMRKLAFSSSGVLIFLEALITFGDKIPGISQVYRAFADLFKGIASSFKGLGSSVDLIGLGFQQVLDGRIEQGLTTIEETLMTMKDLIAHGLSDAWKNFSDGIWTPEFKKLYEVLKFANKLNVATPILRGVAGAFVAPRDNRTSSQKIADQYAELKRLQGKKGSLPNYFERMKIAQLDANLGRVYKNEVKGVPVRAAIGQPFPSRGLRSVTPAIRERRESYEQGFKQLFVETNQRILGGTLGRRGKADSNAIKAMDLEKQAQNWKYMQGVYKEGLNVWEDVNKEVHKFIENLPSLSDLTRGLAENQQLQQAALPIASVVGSFTATRGNVFKMADTEAKKQTGLLQGIKDNTDGLANVSIFN